MVVSTITKGKSCSATLTLLSENMYISDLVSMLNMFLVKVDR